MLSEQTLLRNLAALQEGQGLCPPFAPLDPATTRAIPHENGLRLELRADAHWVPLWGADPESEARRQLEAAGEAAHIFLIGGGVGHVLDAIEQSGRAAKVVVLEPDPGIAVLLLARRDWQSWLTSGRLRLLTGPDYLGASSFARHVNGAEPSAILVNEVMAACRPAAVTRARTVVGRIQQEAAANAEARRRFAGRYLLQTLGNLRVIEREGNVSGLDGAFSGRPAVIVAAGPSLDHNLGTLAQYQDGAVVIAADTTLRPLLAGGVRPHVVVGVDPGDVNARHLAGAPDTSDIWLAAEGSLHPTVFDGFAGRTFIFKVSNHEPWPWLATAGVERGTLRAWGSVVTSAFDLALRTGCNPLIFVGHDFAYTDDRPYCDNTAFHEEWRAYLSDKPWGTIRHYEERMMEGRPLLPATAITGVQVKTTSHLVAFRDWVVEQTTLTPATRFINATGAGILRGGRIEQMPLDAALRAHASQPVSVRPILAARHDQTKGAAGSLGTPISVLLAGFDRAPASDLISRWVDFTAGTVDRETLRAALATQFI